MTEMAPPPLPPRHAMELRSATLKTHGVLARLRAEFEDDVGALAARSEDDSGRTPSQIAAAAGHEGTAALLARAEAAILVARHAHAERLALRWRKAAIAGVVMGFVALRSRPR